jgi:hypothetical protein
MGQVAGRYMKKKSAYWVRWGNLKKRDYLQDLGVNRKKGMILKLIFKSCVGDRGLDSSGSV